MVRKDGMGDEVPPEALDPIRLIAHIPLRPYQHIIDLRCAGGHFTIPLAKSLFDGKVYALDSTGASLDELKEKLPKTRLGNVELITTKRQRQAIPDGSLDGALAPFLLSRTEEKKVLLQDMAKLLKRGGWGAVLEWRVRTGNGGPATKNRLGEAELIELTTGAGFQYVATRDLGGGHYLVLLRK